ncbi:hypothetical protein ACFFLM_04340 [Deinococcus oregonensis]|uniref:Uncharacterized protein n=1 Tax=Deinococcus oregonensis TaxID=1805970 RepID=A0ABV6AX78_9DEIO
MFSRWDLLNPTNILALLLAGWAISVYHRPRLPEIEFLYSRFDDLMPWSLWGWLGLGTACMLVFTPRASPWRLLAHALCGTFMLALSGAFAAAGGITFEVTSTIVLAAVSAILFARTSVHWASSTVWWAWLVSHPPRWLRRLAHIDDGQEREEGRDG